MPRENVEVLRAYLTAWNAGDMDAVRESFIPDVVAVAPDGWPEPGPFVGRDVLMRQWIQMRETFDADQITAIGDVVTVDDTLAMRFIWRGVGHGPDANLEATCLYTVRGERIARMEFFWDHAEALKALGAEEEPMSQANVEIVRSVFDRYLHGDEAAALALFAPDIVVTQFPDQLDGREFHGHLGVREVMAEWIGIWDDWTIELLRASELGGRVLTIARQRGRGKASGVPIESEVAFLFTIRRGAIARWQMFRTEHEALEAVAPEE